MITRRYTGRSLRPLLSPSFAEIRTRVMGKTSEAFTLPARLGRPVARLVLISAQHALLRRFGWFLFATARRRV